MRKIILYIATSLDGYIAGLNHDLNWLFDDADYGYSAFYNSISTTLMGNETYRLVLTFGEFPYKDKENFVFTRNRKIKDDQNVAFISADIIDFVKKLKNKKDKAIWLIGGGEINTLLLKENLIDEMIISVHPVILGNGIPLFRDVGDSKQFEMKSFKEYKSGLVQLTYKNIHATY